MPPLHAAVACRRSMGGIRLKERTDLPSPRDDAVGGELDYREIRTAGSRASPVPLCVSRENKRAVLCCDGGKNLVSQGCSFLYYQTEAIPCRRGKTKIPPPRAAEVRTRDRSNVMAFEGSYTPTR